MLQIIHNPRPAPPHDHVYILCRGHWNAHLSKAPMQEMDPCLVSLANAYNKMIAALERGRPFVTDMCQLVSARERQTADLQDQIKVLGARLQGRERALELMNPASSARQPAPVGLVGEELEEATA